MPRDGYENLSIPTNILKAIHEIVSEEDSLYVSASELIKEALRDKIIEIRSQNRDWKMKKRKENDAPRVL
jgi:metal-responsive CopG/Arc/MetJ family transcriptional regulator